MWINFFYNRIKNKTGYTELYEHALATIQCVWFLSGSYVGGFYNNSTKGDHFIYPAVCAMINECENDMS